MTTLALEMDCAAVLGIDIDDWACRNSTENALVNHCSNVRIEKSDVNLIDHLQFQVHIDFQEAQRGE